MYTSAYKMSEILDIHMYKNPIIISWKYLFV